jgi:hypothetical protein
VKLDGVTHTSGAVLFSSEKKKRKRYGKVERAEFKKRKAEAEREELRTLLGRSVQLNSLNASFAKDLAVHLTRQKPPSLLHHSAVTQIVPVSVVNSVEQSLADDSWNNSEKGLQEKYCDTNSPIEQTSAASPTQESPTSPFGTASSTTEGLNFVGAHLDHRQPSPSYQDIPPSPIFIPNSPYQPQSPRPRFFEVSKRSYPKSGHSYRGNSRRRPSYNRQTQQRRRYDSYRPSPHQPTLTREE